MQALIVLAVTFALLWVLFILPQQRRVRAHHQLIAGLDEGDEVVLTAGIYGRITELGPEDMMLEVAPGMELRVARQAVLRRIETAEPGADAAGADGADAADAADDAVDGPFAGATDDDRVSPTADDLPLPGPESTKPADSE